jgi:hypothetical protein
LDDFKDNLTSILKSVLGAFIVKFILQNKRYARNEVRDYLSSIEAEFDPLKGSIMHDYAICSLKKASKHIPWGVCKAKVKRVIPFPFLKYIHFARSFIWRYSNKAF